MRIRFVVNGRETEAEAAADTPLLWVLREQLALLGTKFGCGKGLCGACTVHLDGDPIRSCVTPIRQVENRSVTTIEGLAKASGDALFRAWIEESVPQCGYCQPGQIMSAAALLVSHPNPNDEQIIQAMSGNLCRCGTYLRIRRAIRRASGSPSGGGSP